MNLASADVDSVAETPLALTLSRRLTNDHHCMAASGRSTSVFGGLYGGLWGLSCICYRSFGGQASSRETCPACLAGKVKHCGVLRHETTPLSTSCTCRTHPTGFHGYFRTSSNEDKVPSTPVDDQAAGIPAGSSLRCGMPLLQCRQVLLSGLT